MHFFLHPFPCVLSPNHVKKTDGKTMFWKSQGWKISSSTKEKKAEAALGISAVGKKGLWA
jgi:hypothetical protein